MIGFYFPDCFFIALMALISLDCPDPPRTPKIVGWPGEGVEWPQDDVKWPQEGISKVSDGLSKV